MRIRISLTAGEPIYRQIVNQIKYLVAAGRLVEDERLPAILALNLLERRRCANRSLP